MHSTDAVYCYIWSGVVCVSLCLCVCVLSTPVSLAKTAEPIDMSFGWHTQRAQ